MPLQVTDEREAGREAGHFWPIDQATRQDTNQASLLFNVGSRSDVLAGLLKRLAVEKDVTYQTAGVFEAW